MKDSKRKKTSYVGTVLDGSKLAFIGVAISIIGLVLSLWGLSQKSDITKKNSLVQHIENLNEMSKNLAIFQNFISEQKQNLLAEQVALENLKKERETLEPLIESDKKAVEALFIEQEKRQRKNIWNERAFGFFTGILSSLIASFIYIKITKRKNDRTQTNRLHGD